MFSIQTTGLIMACSPTTGIPGTPNISSGYTSQLVQQAFRCDQARVLRLLQQGGGNCCPSQPSTLKAAVYASVLEQEAATRCQANQVRQVDTFPKVGVPESVRIQRVQYANLQCSFNQFNPETRFAMYKRYEPPAPCPAPTAAQLNSTAPKPTFFGCQPSRIFDSPI
jgi:hypothetical protein